MVSLREKANREVVCPSGSTYQSRLQIIYSNAGYEHEERRMVADCYSDSEVSDKQVDSRINSMGARSQ